MTDNPLLHVRDKRPLYISIARALQYQIEAGAYAPHQKLPAEKVLSQSFQVNRHTIHQAMEYLIQQQFVYSVRGKGNFVARQERHRVHWVTDKSRYSLIARKTGRNYQVRVLNAALVSPPPAAMEHLALAPGAKVIRIEILRQIDEASRYLSVSYLPEEQVPELEQNLTRLTSLHNLLGERYGLTLRRALLQVGAGCPT